MSDVRIHYFYEVPTYVDAMNLNTYVRTYLHKYVHTYICTYVQMLGTYPCTYVHKEHMYLRIRTYIHGYICTYVFTYLQTYLHTYLRTYVLLCTVFSRVKLFKTWMICPFVRPSPWVHFGCLRWNTEVWRQKRIFCQQKTVRMLSVLRNEWCSSTLFLWSSYLCRYHKPKYVHSYVST